MDGVGFWRISGSPRGADRQRRTLQTQTGAAGRGEVDQQAWSAGSCDLQSVIRPSTKTHRAFHIPEQAAGDIERRGRKTEGLKREIVDNALTTDRQYKKL